MARNVRATKEKSYLERLVFDTKLRGDFIWQYIGNMRIVMLLIVSILFLGIVSYLSIPRRLNPEIKISIVSVVTVLPGASPSDVESLVTIPIETSLQNISGIDTMSSQSKDNVSVITLQFLSSVSQDKAKNDVQSAVDGISTLPKDAQAPSVKAFDFEDQPIWTFALSADELPSLMRFADTLKKNIENTPKIDRVTVNGFESQEVGVIVHPDKLRDYSINPAVLAGIVKSNIISYPAGILDTGSNSFSLTIDPQITSLEDIRALRIPVGNGTVALGDIATVVERSASDQRPSYLGTAKDAGKRVVTFNVYKSGTANIDEAAKAAHDTVDTTLRPYGNRFTVTSVTDTAALIDKQFFNLLDEFKSTILLVFACLFIFLGLRQAIIASVTVPLTFLAGFVFMRYLGMSINFLSMFAFLLALGLLVDDTIVTVSAMTSYFRSGKFTPQETGRMVWRDTIVPIWSTTITTIWSFVPLLLSTGIIGEFIKPIPVVVTVTMICSTAIAVLITLPFMIFILKPSVPGRVAVLGKLLAFIAVSGLFIAILHTNPMFPLLALTYIALLFVARIVIGPLGAILRRGAARYPWMASLQGKLKQYTDNGIISIDVLSRKYHWLISKILSSKKSRRFVLFGIIFYALWAFALLPMGFVKSEFFPKEDNDTMFVNLELPQGATTENTTRESLTLLDELRKTQETQFVTDDVGAAMSNMGAGGSGDNTAMFTLHLTPKESRHVSSVTIAESVRQKFATYPRGTVTVVEESGGPPAGADLQIKLLGDDLGQLNTYADTIVAHLKQQQGVTDVGKSIKPGTSKLVFVPDTLQLSRYGVTVDALGLWLRSFASGLTLSDAKFENNTREKKDIVFSFDGAGESPELLGTISVPTSQGMVPLLSLGTLTLKNNPTVITRESGKRTISVSATVRPGFNTAEKNAELQKFVGGMNFANGYSTKTGGVNDENAKSVTAILQAMGLAFILILVTMVLQFQSYRQAALVLLVIPLAVSSDFFIFALTGTPLSFPALIGILSLFGIVVTNSMFIVDKININLRQGMPFVEAIADSGSSRMEPIILTKLCTVLGLLPITFANALWRGLGGAIIAGLLMASSIMLLFIPVVYYEWYKGEYGIKE
jgi:HAE1 family hydrophobic/amphiphilic exporter-1